MCCDRASRLDSIGTCTGPDGPRKSQHSAGVACQGGVIIDVPRNPAVSWCDNSAENQPLVDGVPKESVDVGWGEGTFDEMCLGVLLISRQ